MEKDLRAPPAAARRPSPAPAPPWALGVAILLGALAALLPSGSAPHLHHGHLASYVHSHPYLGAHSHSRERPETPLPPGPGQERDDDTVALHLACSLGAPLPALQPAAAAALPPPPAAPPQLPRSAEPAAPGSPRGPPPSSCC